MGTAIDRQKPRTEFFVCQLDRNVHTTFGKEREFQNDLGECGPEVPRWLLRLLSQAD